MNEKKCRGGGVLAPGHTGAIILLHEIYGVNAFIRETAEEYKKTKLRVICPDMLGRPPFGYDETEEAYAYFAANVGFGRYKKINAEIGALSKTYERVFVMGYSVGATLAWLCSENPALGGVVCLYGSRVRDFTHIDPACPALMIFARHDSFDAEAVADKLKTKPLVQCEIFDAAHGFMDKRNAAYDPIAAKKARKQIFAFLGGNPPITKEARRD